MKIFLFPFSFINVYTTLALGFLIGISPIGRTKIVRLIVLAITGG